MKRIPLILFAALAVTASAASAPFSTFGKSAAEFFDKTARPKALQSEGLGALTEVLTYPSNDGNKETKIFEVDPNDIEGTINAALEGIRATVSTATDNAVRALARAATLAELVKDNAERIGDILNGLSAVFEVLSKVTIEDPDTGETKELPMKVVNNEVHIVGSIAQPVKVDGVSVDTNATGELRLLDFSGASAGQIPYVDYYYGGRNWLTYRYFGSFFDSSLFAGQTNISLIGWNNARHDMDNYGPGFCADDLATQLTADNTGVTDRHYVLTAYGEDDHAGGANWTLHYTPVGTLTNISAAANLPWAWDSANATFRNPWVQVGRTTQTVTVGTGLTDGTYYIAVDMASQTVTFSQGTTPASDDATAYFTIGTITNGKLTTGITSMPICIFWE